jgi:hypothetical protein
MEGIIMKRILMKIVVKVSVITIIALSVPTISFALMWGESADLTGSIDWETGGIVATGNWAAAGTSLSWDITDNSDGTFTYEYTWVTAEKDLSHIIIELTEDIITDDDIVDLVGSVDIDEFEVKLNTENQGNPGLPLSFYGIKIDLDEDTTEFVFSFTVEQAPVWGNFYAKDGKTGGRDGIDIVAYNTDAGFGESDYFIARPDGVPVPEPATMLLLGSGLIGLGLFGRRKFKNN